MDVKVDNGPIFNAPTSRLLFLTQRWRENIAVSLAERKWPVR